MRVEAVVRTADTVGESPVWDEREGALLWVDIVGRRIHRWFPAEDRLETRAAPDFATSVGLRDDGGAVVGLRREVVLWDLESGFEPLATPEPDVPDNRLNEGVVGPDGRYWVGTMQDNLEDDGRPRAMDRASGALYRIDPSGAVERLTEPTIGLANTLAWLPDGRLVTADSLADALYAYAPGDGDALGDREPFAAGFGRGVPDGSCVDAEGGLWNCRVAGGACLVRFRPDGAVDRVMELPCHSPTSCCFGGPGLDVLYVTSARFGLDAAHLAERPLEGSVFALRPGVAGRAPYRFGARPDG